MEDKRAEEASTIVQVRNGSDLDQDSVVGFVGSSQASDTF